MSRRPLVVRSVPALRKIVARYRAKGETVALVPTMGALHDGHLSLVRAAHRRAKRVIVSIFVNPAQFAPTEDFKTYPRSFNADLAMLAALKVDLIWAPTVAGDVSGRLFDKNRARRSGLGRTGGQVPSALFRRRRDRGVQIVPASDARLRDLRREGLPAAQGRDAHGARPRSSVEGDRRADRARKGRPRHVLPQRLPLAGGSQDRAAPASGAEGHRRRHQGRERRRVPPSHKDAAASSKPDSRSIISRRGMPKRWRRSRPRRTARSACWSRRGSEQRG